MEIENFQNDSKSSWPELVGRNVDEAIEVIKQENSQLNVIKVKSGSPVTRDFRLDRVRVFYNEIDNTVCVAPNCG